MIGKLFAALLTVTSTAVFSASAGLWDRAELGPTPKAEWTAESNGLRQVYYEGATLSGKATRVFAYYGKPDGAGPFPAVVLVHGGGGKAFPDWVKHWTARGYAAIAMDTAGCGPAGRLPDGGPDQGDKTKFRDFAGEDDAKNMWTYHAVSAAIRAHSLLLSLPEIDKTKTALTGISWGGYLTCIIAGVDHRFQCAVPVYGCGFLHENSTWLPSHFNGMTEDRRKRWVEAFDPSRHLGRVTCPMLFLDGTCDFAYPMDSLQKSYRLVKSPVTLSVEINRKHGHIWSFPEVDAFIDSHLRGAKPLMALGGMRLDGNTVTSATDAGPDGIKAAELNYTTDTGEWKKRVWKTAPATVHLLGGTAFITATLPQSRPMVAYLRATDPRGYSVTTPHIELP